MTTDALRKQVVEAMAAAMFECDDQWDTDWSSAVDLGTLYSEWAHDVASVRKWASAALDAALDVLGEFVEAADAGAKRADLSPLVAHGLLAVLRAGKGSDE